MSEKEILLKLVELAYDINKKTNDHVFIDYSPHVNSADIHIYKDGFGKSKPEYYIVYLNDHFSVIDRVINTSTAIKLLEDMLNG